LVADNVIKSGIFLTKFLKYGITVLTCVC